MGEARILWNGQSFLVLSCTLLCERNEPLGEYYYHFHSQKINKHIQNKTNVNNHNNRNRKHCRASIVTSSKFKVRTVENLGGWWGMVENCRQLNSSGKHHRFLSWIPIPKGIYLYAGILSIPWKLTVIVLIYYPN